VVPPEGDLPIPDPQELYVGTADGAALRFQGSGGLLSSWGPNGGIAVIETGYSDPQVSILSLIQPDGALDPVVELEGWISGNPVWSPGGDRLLLTHGGLGSARVVSVRLRDGEATELTDGGQSYDDVLGWPLPDAVLVIRETDHGGALLWMDPDTGDTRLATDADVHTVPYAGGAALSADGTRLLTGGSEPGGTCQGSGIGDAVYIVDLATGDATKVAQAESCSVASVAWSPDETAVAYSVFGMPEGSGAFVVEPATGVSRRISSDLDSNLRWLDEDTLISDRLVCWQCDGGVEGLMLLRADGRGEEELLEGGGHAVSPAGDRIAVADGDGVRITALDGSLLATVSGPAPAWQYWGLTWAPDGEQFTYVRFHSRANTRRLFEVGADAGELKTVASIGVNEYLSPDSTRLAIIRQGTPEDEKASTLWLADADGSNERQVDVVGVGALAWSPDSGKLAFIADWDTPVGQPGASVYIVDANGGGLRNLKMALNDKGPGAPVWAPDGGHLAIPDQYRLYLIDVTDGEVATVDVASIGGAGSISWSVDSRTVAAAGGASSVPRDGGNVVLVNADGSELRAVPKTSSPVWGVGLSPDGSQVAYWKTSGGGTRAVLVLADSRTGDARALASAALTGPWRIAWSPDGARFATPMVLPGGSGIYTVDVDDLEIRQVTDGGNAVDLWWAGNDRLRFTTEIGGL
jgi:Tol biopolymer transport system component